MGAPTYYIFYKLTLYVLLKAIRKTWPKKHIKAARNCRRTARQPSRLSTLLQSLSDTWLSFFPLISFHDEQLQSIGAVRCALLHMLCSWRSRIPRYAYCQHQPVSRRILSRVCLLYLSSHLQHYWLFCKVPWLQTGLSLDRSFLEIRVTTSKFVSDENVVAQFADLHVTFYSSTFSMISLTAICAVLYQL